MPEKCRQGEERNLMRDTLQRCFGARRILFQINSETLPPLEAFPYLGRTVAYNNIYWASVYLNLRKFWRRWGIISRVLESMGATVRYRGELYKAGEKLVLLYGRESLVVTGEMLKFLMVYHHQAVQ